MPDNRYPPDPYNDPHHDPDNDPAAEADPPEEAPEAVPASVAFMEMMRQAAARTTPQIAPNTPVDQTPYVDLPPDFSARLPPESADADDSPAFADEAAADAVPPPRRRVKSEQQIQRVQRRRARRARQAVGVLGGIIRSFIIVLMAAGLTATIFTWWTPTAFIDNEVRQELSVAAATSAATFQPTGLPTPNSLRRIGIVSGHRGPENDPGAVCPDGLTEAEINLDVAQRVVSTLRGRGYTVDLLDEFDARLQNYQAEALVSIHANTCQDYGEFVSGFLIAAPGARTTVRSVDQLLVQCIAQRYHLVTGLQQREGVTLDMTDYHSFREINPRTPAAILELGFMLGDREILTEAPDLLAQGITDGLLCFLEPSAGSTPTPIPRLTPENPS
ncbi:MAG: hypothetical protein GYB67_18130 [Chloroflexi bacterium]|nr:hypothetical protein [Chloroflexota bacterium]